MKAFVVLAVLVAVARAGVVHAPLGVYGVAETGTSAVHRAENGIGGYSFGYDEAHTSGGSFHKESGAPGVKVGSYGLHGADGRVRVVNYVADGLGFRADIKTNEPGVDSSQDPAATTINKGAVFAAASYAAPIAHHAVAAPIHHGVVAPYAHHGVVAPYAHHGVVAHHGAIAPAYNAIAHHGVAGHVLGASYSSAVHHGVAPVHHNVVAPAYASALHHGVVAPAYSGFHHGVVAPAYSAAIHHGVVAPAVHHGIGYGLGYGGAIHGGLGYAGLVGHVGKVHHF